MWKPLPVSWQKGAIKVDVISAAKEIRMAIRQGDLDQVRNIIEFDHDALNIITPFGTWLHVAASMGRLDILKYFINCGLDPNIEAGTFNAGAINIAAAEGHIEIVEYLLSCGARMDISEPDHNPLFAAIYGGHKDIVKLLLDNGIDPSVSYSGDYMKNMDAYAFALERGQKEIAEMLIPCKK